MRPRHERRRRARRPQVVGEHRRVCGDAAGVRVGGSDDGDAERAPLLPRRARAGPSARSSPPSWCSDSSCVRRARHRSPAPATAGVDDARATCTASALVGDATDGSTLVRMQNDDVWLVVPLYNEATVIADVVREARAVFPNIVCVDDGSQGRLRRGRRARPGPRSCATPSTSGRAPPCRPASTTPSATRRMRYVVTFDADGQHQIHDVEVMVERHPAWRRAGRLRLALPRRAHRGPASKRLVLRAAVAYTNLTTGTRLTDAHNGLRVLHRDVVERLDITQNRMAHASEIVAQIGAMRFDGQGRLRGGARCTSSTPTTPGPRASRSGTPSTSWRS